MSVSSDGWLVMASAQTMLLFSTYAKPWTQAASVRATADDLVEI